MNKCLKVIVGLTFKKLCKLVKFFNYKEAAFNILKFGG